MNLIYFIAILYRPYFRPSVGRYYDGYAVVFSCQVIANCIFNSADTKNPVIFDKFSSRPNNLKISTGELFKFSLNLSNDTKIQVKLVVYDQMETNVTFFLLYSG